MAILLAKSRIVNAIPYEVLSTVTVDQEGMALTSAMENGLSKARPSSGTANHLFLGISQFHRSVAPTTMPKIEVLTAVDIGGGLAKVVLAKPVISGSILVRGDATGYGSGTALAVAATVDANTKYKLEADNVTVTVHSDLIGKKIFVVYRYDLTVAAARTMYGDALPGFTPIQQAMTVNAIVTGLVYTDQFNTSVDWSTVDTDAAAEVLKCAANGRFDVNVTGASCAGYAVVHEAPTIDQPYLGIYVTRE